MAEVQEKRHVVNEAPHCKIYSDGTIFIGPVRASYPHLFTPFEGKDKKIRFGVVGLMPKTEEYDAARSLLARRINAMIKSELKLEKLASDRKFLRDGDNAGKDEYEGMFTVSAGDGKRRPQVLDNRKDPRTGKAKVLTKEDGGEDRVYAGCWVNMLIRPWAQSSQQWGKRINANLIAVQFVDDDEAFGTGRISEDAIHDTMDEFADEGSGFDDGLGEDDEL